MRRAPEPGIRRRSPQAGVITACSAHVASDSPSRRQSRMTRSAVCRASPEPSAGLLPPARPTCPPLPLAPPMPAPPMLAPPMLAVADRLVGPRRDRARQQPHARLRGLGHPVLVPAP